MNVRSCHFMSALRRALQLHQPPSAQRDFISALEARRGLTRSETAWEARLSDWARNRVQMSAGPMRISRAREWATQFAAPPRLTNGQGSATRVRDDP